MPAAVISVGASLAGAAAASAAVGASLVVAGGIGAALIEAAVTVGVGAILTSAAGLDSQATMQAATGVQVNTDSQADVIPTVYGSTRIGGVRRIVGASGENNEYLHFVIVHCEGEVQGASMLYLDDTPYTDEKFNGLVHWEFFVGTDNQTACQTLLDAGVGWRTTDRLQGTAYSYVRIKYDQTNLGSVPAMTVIVQGKRCYDPRSNMVGWTNNPVICLLDYLTNARYGRGIPLTQLDLPSFITAANVCNDTYIFRGNIVGLIQSIIHSLHTCNGVTTPNVTTLENTRAILTAFRGRLVYSAKGYSVLADTARAATFNFNPDNIIGAWQITPPGKRIKLNKVVASWVNPNDLYEEDLYPAESLAFRAEDRGLLLEERISLPFTQVVHEAQILAERHLRQSRIGIAVSFKAFVSALTCEVGDVVTITHPTPGWVAKPFTITMLTLLSGSEVKVDCREYDSVVYSAHALTDPRTTYTTLLPDPSKVPAMTSQTLASGATHLELMTDGTIISRILVTWTPLTEIYLKNGRVEIQYKKTSDLSWTTQYSDIAAGWAYLSPMADTLRYDVRTRYINELGIAGAWQLQQHTVVGKRSPPAFVSNFQATVASDRIVLSWDAVPDKDLAEYELREGTTWETAIKLGSTKSTTLKVLANFVGDKTWLIKAVDTTNNYSADAASVSVSVGLPPATTLVAEVIDNTVLLRWQEVHGTLPTKTYELRVGTTFATATKIGTKDGLFTTIFESQTGVYRYWVTAIDTAGNLGTPTSVAASVSAPPDYLLFNKLSSSYTGAKTNALLEGNALLLPVNTTETWDTHFTTRSWTTPQNQIDAGYPLFLQPTQSSGTYVETIDYGQVLPGFKITVDYQVAELAAGCTLACTLSTSVDGTTWTTPITATQAFMSNFRYLKVTLTATNSGTTGMLSLTGLTVKLDTKRKTYGGKINCLATDANGTEVFLTSDGTSTGTKLFLDVISLTPGAVGTTQQTAVFDIMDVPKPLSFKAYLFNAAGTRISGTVYYTVIGV